MRLALALPALEALLSAEAAALEAQAEAARRRDNPEIGYAREHLPGDGGAAEDELTFGQRFELSDSRELRAEAVRSRRRLIGLDVETRRRALTTEVRSLFYDVLALQARHDVVSGFVTQLGQALALVARREAEGDASAYDRQRLALEVRTARVRLAGISAARAQAWSHLAVRIGRDPGGDAWPKVAGDLVPSAPGPGSVEGAPALIRRRVEAEVARLIARAESARSAPSLTLQGGVKAAAGGDERRFGYVGGVRLELPWGDDGAAAATAAERRADAFTARESLDRSDLAARAAGLRQALVSLMEASARLRREGATADTDLRRAASAAYAGGERSLIELLDAERAAMGHALAILDLERQARRAATKLAALAGDPP